MSKKDARVDAYIRKAAPFAQPILQHLRSVAHAASPEIEEAMKWGFPHFMHKGMLCGTTPPRRRWASSAGSPRSRNFRRRKY